MKLLFLRSQLVDVEFGVRNGAGLGDVNFGLDAGLGNRLSARRRGRNRSWRGSLWFGMAGGRTGGRRRRVRSDAADGFGDFLFERTARAWLQGDGGEAG